MDTGIIYLIGTILFTIGGWQLGKSIWRSKGADPGRGKWYGAFLGFLLGIIGILTLLGIAWRWHPASEPHDTTPDEEDRRHRSITTRPRALAGLGLSLAFIAVGLGVVAFGLGGDALRYLRWADQVGADGTRVTRAVCAEVTLDWGACYVPDGRGLTDREWRARWSGEASERAFLAGTAVVIGAGCGLAAAWAWRTRARALAVEARRDDAEAAARLGTIVGIVDPGSVDIVDPGNATAVGLGGSFDGRRSPGAESAQSSSTT